MSTTVELPSLHERCSPEEWAVRVDLAAAYRLVAYYGWDDLIFTHLSARVPGPEHHFLINPFGLLFEEITASSLVKVDRDGRAVEPTPFALNPAGFTIHSAVHEARPDAQAVMHLHTQAGVAVSTHTEGLMPLNQQALLVGDVAYHDYRGLALDLEERPLLVADLGARNAMLLRNHGTLAVGPTVADAFLTMYFLERSCEIQVATLAANVALTAVPLEVRAIVAKQREAGFPGVAALAWSALLRMLDRQDSSYRS
jgi:ribulose-5-phosphate 4-epimerase/fuculose-1-phosphate aldolase